MVREDDERLCIKMSLSLRLVSAGVLSDGQIDESRTDRDLNKMLFFPIEFPEIE